MTPLEAILLTIVTASTPLLIAAIGELVAERAGVLNLGVEGMMAMGAACGFAAAIGFNSTAAGIAIGILAGAGMAAIFAFAVLGLAANQVGSGLALTILGLGLSGLIGAPSSARGATRSRICTSPGSPIFPGSAASSSARTPSSMSALALAAAVALFLNRSRAGLTLRAVGENHVSAHALGLPVLRTRFLAILFGGACAGPCRRLSLARLHPLLVARHDRGPGLDRACARRVRGVAPGLCARRRLSLRRRDGAPAARPGRPDRIAVAASLGRALPGDDPHPRPALDRPRPGRRARQGRSARRSCRTAESTARRGSTLGRARGRPRARARSARRARNASRGRAA